MSYAVELTPRARDKLRELQTVLAEAVLDHIDLLALDPIHQSLAGGDDEPYQYHRFTWEGRQVTIPFQYSQDEQTLIIIQIIVVDL